MFIFLCPKCTGKSSSDGITWCSFCGCSEPLTAEGDNFNLTEPEASRQFGTASESENHLLPNDMIMAEVVGKHDRKRNEENVRMITDNTPAHKRSRSGNSGMSGDIPYTYRQQGGINYDFTSEQRETKVIATNASGLDSLYNKIPNNRRSHPYNQGMDELGNLQKNIRQNSASNFSSYQSTENEIPLKEILDSRAPIGERITSFDNVLAVPGPSGFHENKNTSNLRVKKLQSISSLELQSVGVKEKIRSEKKCLPQKGANSTHSTEKPRCNVCEEVIYEEEAHGIEKTCKLCNKKFQCKTQLEQHSLVHEGYYYFKCRVCGKEFSSHIVYGKKNLTVAVSASAKLAERVNY